MREVVTYPHMKANHPILSWRVRATKVVSSEVWCNGSSPNGSKNYERSPMMMNVVISGLVLTDCSHTLSSCKRDSHFLLAEWCWHVRTCRTSSLTSSQMGQLEWARCWRATMTLPVAAILLIHFVTKTANGRGQLFRALPKVLNEMLAWRISVSTSRVSPSRSTKALWVIWW